MLESGDLRLVKTFDHKWFTVVKDKNFHYDCQVTLKNEVIKDLKCNCVHFKNNDFCAHLAASLMHVRKELEKGEIIKKKEKSKSGKSRKDTIKTIIQNLDKEELGVFIKELLRKNNSLKLFTMAHFAEYLDLEEKQKLVDSAFPPFTKAKEKVTASRIRDFFVVSDELIAYFKSLIVQKNYTDAYQILFLLLKKSFYIKYHIEGENKTFEKNHVQLLDSYHEIIKLVEAPEYKQFIYKELLQLVETSYIIASLKSEKALWIMLYENHVSRDKFKQIVDKHFISRTIKDPTTLYFINTLKLLLSTEKEREVLVKDLDPQDIYKITQNLNDYPKISGSEELLLNLYLSKNLNKPLAKALLTNLRKFESYPEMASKIVDYYIKYEDPYFIIWARENINDQKQFIKTAHAGLQRYDPSYMIGFYYYLGDSPKSLEILNDYQSIDLLFQFGHLLIEGNASKISELYQSVCSSYLEEHFGPPSYDFMTKVYRHLVFHKQKEIQQQLIAYLKKRYPDREGIYP